MRKLLNSSEHLLIKIQLMSLNSESFPSSELEVPHASMKLLHQQKYLIIKLTHGQKPACTVEPVYYGHFGTNHKCSGSNK